MHIFCRIVEYGAFGHSIIRETISTVWVPPVVMDSEHAFASKIIGRAGGLAANLRAQILRHGVKGVSTFRRGIRDAVERGGVGEISQEAFCASAGCAGAKLTVSIQTTTLGLLIFARCMGTIRSGGTLFEACLSASATTRLTSLTAAALCRPAKWRRCAAISTVEAPV